MCFYFYFAAQKEKPPASTLGSLPKYVVVEMQRITIASLPRPERIGGCGLQLQYGENAIGHHLLAANISAR